MGAPATVGTATQNDVSGHDLRFLDGLRGLSAIAVAVYHSFLYAQSVKDDGGHGVGRVVSCGQFGVTVFIVLSGFVLALPVARSGDYTIRGGVLAFFRRRARRILPPYYAALLGFLGVILVVPGLNERSGTDWDSKIPVRTDDVAAHVLLVQNLFRSTAFKIDGPMWSVATEWQIYFALPLLLIPVWSRFGPVAAALLALVLGLALQPLIPAAHPVYLGLFAFGVLAADVVARPRRPFQDLPWGVAALGLVAGGLGIAVLRGLDQLWALEAIIGAGVACGIVALITATGSRSVAACKQALSHRHVVGLGLFSYSVYLLHSPLIAWFNLITRDVSMPTLVRFAMLVLVALPLAVAVAYGFFLLVERRFLSGHQAAVAQRAEVNVP